MCSELFWKMVRIGVALGLAGPVLAQGIVKPGERVPATSAPASIALEGYVWLPDGAPAEGAVVVSSAGGRAVVDVAGRYRLETSVPPEAERVQVTAVSAAATNLTASTSVALTATSGFGQVDPLHLTKGLRCEPDWLPTFGGFPGMTGPAHAMTVFDDGSGPALYVGGAFLDNFGSGLNNIAKWNGSSWAPLGSGLLGSGPTGSNSTVFALTVYDDGSGPALYAGGWFTKAGGVPANFIAKWNGSSWAPLGSGMNSRVLALTVYDDGGGPALYAGGWFTTAGGVQSNHIAKWDGSSWAPLRSGMNSYVHALTVYDDGSGPALYAGGKFTQAGVVTANRIARWNGSSWAALGSGISGAVESLTVFDDGGGPELYAGGHFTEAGGVPANDIAKWDGSSWSLLGSGLTSENRTVLALTVYDDGSGLALYAGGHFASGMPGNNIAKWDGSSWAPLGSGISSSPFTSTPVYALMVYDDGSGPALYAGGTLTTAGGVAAKHIAKWDGSSWAAFGSGLDSTVRALMVHDDGSGAALYAGGYFATAGEVFANRIAKWDGSSWAALGSGILGTAIGGSPSPGVNALTVYDDGGGPELYAGGNFWNAGGVSAEDIAKWNGSSWAALGSGISGEVLALTVHDDGSGPAVYAGGDFTTAGGVPANRIAKWNGSSWAALGSGMSSNVHALTVHDDGGGPALYAGGIFTHAGGVPANGIAKWDGSSWAALGSGISGGTFPRVNALTVHDDGMGPALYAGGFFTTAGGMAASNIAKWNGSSWSALGSGISGSLFVYDPYVASLTVFDDGNEPALYAGGFFTTAGGMAASNIAKWNGSSWSALGGGMKPSVGSVTSVDALTMHDDGGGPALCAGGNFFSSSAGDSFLAKWGCLPAGGRARRR